MQFREFWFGLSIAARKVFADACETTVGHLDNVARGYKPAGEKLAVCIDRESRGVVRCESLRDDVDWAYLRGSAPPSITSSPKAASRKRA